MQKVIRIWENCSNRLIIPIIRNLEYFGLWYQISAYINAYHQVGDIWKGKLIFWNLHNSFTYLLSLVSTTVFAGVDIDETDDDPDIMEEASAPEKYELSETVRWRFEFWSSLCLSFLFSAFSYLERNRVLKINLSKYRKWITYSIKIITYKSILHDE